MFASRIALSAEGRTLAAASPTDRPGFKPSSASGSVFVFHRGADGAWTQRVRRERFGAPNSVPNNFGDPTALSGDGRTLAVGAYTESGTIGGINPPEVGSMPDAQGEADASDTGVGPNSGAFESGAVYVFGADTSGAWQRRAFLKARGAPAFDQLDADVALSGDFKVLAAKACGFAANADGLRRNHRAGAMVY